MEAETVAFGYPARALVLEQRVRKRTFGYPRHAPSLTASDGLAGLSRAWDFRSDLVHVAEIFFETGEPQSSQGGPLIRLFRNALAHAFARDVA